MFLLTSGTAVISPLGAVLLKAPVRQRASQMQNSTPSPERCSRSRETYRSKRPGCLKPGWLSGPSAPLPLSPHTVSNQDPSCRQLSATTPNLITSHVIKNGHVIEEDERMAAPSYPLNEYRGNTRTVDKGQGVSGSSRRRLYCKHIKGKDGHRRGGAWGTRRSFSESGGSEALPLARRGHHVSSR
ncbi:unnamed protein product [Gadus morhua 'NCC']